MKLDDEHLTAEITALNEVDRSTLEALWIIKAHRGEEQTGDEIGMRAALLGPHAVHADMLPVLVKTILDSLHPELRAATLLSIVGACASVRDDMTPPPNSRPH